MTNKKKSSTISHILSEFDKSLIFSFDSLTINGIPILDLEDKLVKEIPEGYYCKCHICSPPQLLTKQQAENHDFLVHNIKR